MNKGTPNKNKYETGEVRVGITAPDNTWIKADGSALPSLSPSLKSKLIAAGYTSLPTIFFGNNIWGWIKK